MSLDFSDIFGGNARQRLTALESRFRDLADRHKLALAELREVKSHLESVTVSGQSREQYEALSGEYAHKISEIQQAIRKREDDFSRFSSEHEQASSTLNKRIGEVTEHKAGLDRDVAVVAAKLNSLTGEVAAAQRMRIDLDRENKDLGVTRDSAKQDISLLQNKTNELKESVTKKRA